MAEEKVYYVPCQGWGCHEHCTLKTFVKDGKITRTERTELPGIMGDRYRICQKGIMNPKLPFVSQRLTKPLKRVGERGEGKFEEISWEQAFEEIGEKMRAAVDQYGPRSVVINNYCCGLTNNTTGSLALALSYRFTSLLDCTQMAEMSVDLGVCEAAIADLGDMMAWFAMDTYHWKNNRPNYMLIWGGNPIGWTRGAGTSRIFMDMQEQGTKLVTIGRLYDTTAAKSDQFIPVKPMTDAALALAMANVIIHEDLVDEDFMLKYTVGPLLVREDNGKLLRRKDIQTQEQIDAARVAEGFTGASGEAAMQIGYAAAGGSTERTDPINDYVAWNGAPAKAIFVAPGQKDIPGNPVLEADVVINGIRCKSAYRLLKEHLAKWTPEAQEEITGVPAETCRQVAIEYCQAKPAAMYSYFGMRYTNAGQAYRAMMLLPLLSGNLGEKNGRYQMGCCCDGHSSSLAFPVMIPDMDFANFKGGVVQMTELLDSFENPESQQYKVWINPHSNPVQNWPNRKMWTEKVFKNMDLVVVFELRETDTSAWADYVLPDQTGFERLELAAGLADNMILHGGAIDPVGDAKDWAFIWKGLADQMGFGEKFCSTNEEWIKFELENCIDPMITSIEPPVTYERLQEERVIPMNSPQEVLDYWNGFNLQTPTGRVEFYCEDLLEFGPPMAEFLPAQIHNKAKREKYPLQFYPGRSRFFMQSQFQEIPELRYLDGMKNICSLNPRLALERGIAEGDAIEVFNDRGVVKVHAHLTEYVPTDMALLWYAYPASEYKESDPPTILSSWMGTKETQSDWIVGLHNLKFKQSGGDYTPILLVKPMNYTHETYWDDLCDVRKAEEA
ncbi:MAG: molybdopterin-dependent oxidoreductase [Eggerthellaceae bacterium]|nr:molybdopterin-dependent oxidoreductase [Eggerthellaceae bacterium]